MTDKLTFYNLLKINKRYQLGMQKHDNDQIFPVKDMPSVDAPLTAVEEYSNDAYIVLRSKLCPYVNSQLQDRLFIVNRNNGTAPCSMTYGMSAILFDTKTRDIYIQTRRSGAYKMSADGNVQQMDAMPQNLAHIAAADPTAHKNEIHLAQQDYIVTQDIDKMSPASLRQLWAYRMRRNMQIEPLLRTTLAARIPGYDPETNNFGNTPGIDSDMSNIGNKQLRQMFNQYVHNGQEIPEKLNQELARRCPQYNPQHPNAKDIVFAQVAQHKKPKDTTLRPTLKTVTSRTITAKLKYDHHDGKYYAIFAGTNQLINNCRSPKIQTLMDGRLLMVSVHTSTISTPTVTYYSLYMPNLEQWHTTEKSRISGQEAYIDGFEETDNAVILRLSNGTTATITRDMVPQPKDPFNLDQLGPDLIVKNDATNVTVQNPAPQTIIDPNAWPVHADVITGTNPTAYNIYINDQNVLSNVQNVKFFTLMNKKILCVKVDNPIPQIFMFNGGAIPVRLPPRVPLNVTISSVRENGNLIQMTLSNGDRILHDCSAALEVLKSRYYQIIR